MKEPLFISESHGFVEGNGWSASPFSKDVSVSIKEHGMVNPFGLSLVEFIHEIKRVGNLKSG